MESDDDVPDNQIPASDGLEEIHAYMIHHKMEDNMNELINDTLKVRPEDPYLYMSELLRDKSALHKGIRRCTARQVYGLNGNPTLEVTLTTECGDFISTVPTVDNNKPHGVVHLTDQNPLEYDGKGITSAIGKINNDLAPQVVDKAATDQESIDNTLRLSDPSDNKESIGGNSILAVSTAVCKAGAKSFHIPVEQHILNLCECPIDNIIFPVISPTLFIHPPNGCANLIIQELRLIPIGFTTVKDAVKALTELKTRVTKIIKEEYSESFVSNYSVGHCLYIPETFISDEELIKFVINQIEKNEYNDKIKIGIKFEAEKLYRYAQPGEDPSTAGYALPQCIEKGLPAGKKGSPSKAPAAAKGKKGGGGVENKVPGTVLQGYYTTLLDQYPQIISIEDPYAAPDVELWKAFTESYGNERQIIGGDLIVSKLGNITNAMENQSCNCVRIRLHDLATVWDGITITKLCKNEGWGMVLDVSEGGYNDLFPLEYSMGNRFNMITTGGIESSTNLLYCNEFIRKEEAYVENAIYVGDKFKTTV